MPSAAQPSWAIALVVFVVAWIVFGLGPASLLHRSSRRTQKPYARQVRLPSQSHPFRERESSDSLHDQELRLTLGEILFNPPKQMHQGVKEWVTIRISRSAATEAIKKDLIGRGAPEVEQIQVGRLMDVELFGDGFVVTPPPDHEARAVKGQVVPESGYAEWLYSVLPDKAGPTQILNLRVALQYMLPNGTQETWRTVMSREIAVEVDRLWPIKHFVMDKDNLKWILGGVGTAAAAAIAYFVKLWLGDSSS